MGTAARPGVRELRRQELIVAVAFIERLLLARHCAKLSTCMNSLHPGGNDVSPTSLLVHRNGSTKTERLSNLF